MTVEIASREIISQWLELAKEVEPIFQANMADDPEFNAFMERKLAQLEVLSVRNKNSNLMGVITISRNKNSISWFAVFQMYRGIGVGSKLLEYAINELDSSKEIEVITFREDYVEGIPARIVYQKFGFVDYDLSIEMNGFPRSLMKRYPK